MGEPKGNDGESRHGIAPSRARSGLPAKFAFHQALQPGERAKVQCLGEMPSGSRATAIKPGTGYSALPARKSINAKIASLGPAVLAPIRRSRGFENNPARTDGLRRTGCLAGDCCRS